MIKIENITNNKTYSFPLGKVILSKRRFSTSNERCVMLDSLEDYMQISLVHRNNNLFTLNNTCCKQIKIYSSDRFNITDDKFITPEEEMIHIRRTKGKIKIGVHTESNNFFTNVYYYFFSIPLTIYEKELEKEGSVIECIKRRDSCRVSKLSCSSDAGIKFSLKRIKGEMYVDFKELKPIFKIIDDLTISCEFRTPATLKVGNEELNISIVREK